MGPRGGGRGLVAGIPAAHRRVLCPTDPAPVLEAARSLEDRLQQLQRLEPEPAPLKDISRPWKKHLELVGTKGTLRRRLPGRTRVAVLAPHRVPPHASEHPQDTEGSPQGWDLARGPQRPLLLSPTQLCEMCPPRRAQRGDVTSNRACGSGRARALQCRRQRTVRRNLAAEK